MKGLVTKHLKKYALKAVISCFPYLMMLVGLGLQVVVVISLIAALGGDFVEDDGMISKNLIDKITVMRVELNNETNYNFDPAFIFAIDNIKRDGKYQSNWNLKVTKDEMKKLIVNNAVVTDKNQVCTIFKYNNINCELFKVKVEMWNAFYVSVNVTDYTPPFKEFTQSLEFGDVREPYSPTNKHKGTDLVAIGDTTVFNVYEGEVVFAQTNCQEQPDSNSVDNNIANCPSNSKIGVDRYGNVVVVQHEIENVKYFTVYAHMKDVTVKNGQKIPAGTPIGKQGRSGFSFGDHLHWELRVGANALENVVDPWSFFSKQSNYSSIVPVPQEKQFEMALADIKEEDFQFAHYIFSRESDYNIDYNNLLTGESGICRASNIELMGRYGSDYKTNIVTQMKWCNDYALENYGSWKNSYDHYKKMNGW